MRAPTRAAAVAVLLVLNGCAMAPPDAAGGDGTVAVFGAASLREAFTEISGRFEADNPGSAVESTFAGSADLLSQLTQGAPADVLATADAATMDKAALAGLTEGSPVDFAANTLTIVVAPGNPRRVGSFRDLDRPGLAVVLCAPQVPCGAATVMLERATGVNLDPVSEESQVTDVLTKVISGQADAGVVYSTDARAAGEKVSEVAVPESPVNRYRIAMVKGARNPGAARKFIEFVSGAAGQQALAAAGFLRP